MIIIHKSLISIFKVVFIYYKVKRLHGLLGQLDTKRRTFCEQENEHIRQHASDDGEVRGQPGEPGRGQD